MLHLSGLYRYPLKSAAGEALRETMLDALGVQGDRRWMVVDAESGRFLTQRLLAQMTQLQARWLGSTHLQLSAPDMADLQVAVPDEQAPLRGVTIWRDSLQVPDAGDQAAQWLSQFLGPGRRAGAGTGGARPAGRSGVSGGWRQGGFCRWLSFPADRPAVR